MRWGESNTAWYARIRKQRQAEAHPQLWFAWRPVRLYDGTWIWRENVYWSRWPEVPHKPRGLIQYTTVEQGGRDLS